MLMPRACERCGAMFQPRNKYPQQRFCSRNCGLKATLPSDHNARVSRETAQLRGMAQRDRGEGKSYRKLNGRHEHRRVAEEKLGRALLPSEVVHHRDGNIRNNDPDNIEVLESQAEHARLHMKGKKKSPDSIRKRIETMRATKQAGGSP